MSDVPGSGTAGTDDERDAIAGGWRAVVRIVGGFAVLAVVIAFFPIIVELIVGVFS